MGILQKQLTNILLIFSLLVIASSSSAYTLYKCENGKVIKWGTKTPFLYVTNIGAPTSGTYFQDQFIHEVLYNFNQNPSGLVIHPFTTNPDLPVGPNNNRSDVFWSRGNYTGIFVNQRVNCARGERLEGDVIFNPDGNFMFQKDNKNYFAAYGGSYAPFSEVMIHEVGHFAGLKHTGNRYSSMGGAGHLHTNGEYSEGYPGEDMNSGLMYLYGKNRSTYSDLAVTHFKRIGSENGYSIHEQTQMFKKNGDKASSRMVDGVKGAWVRPGSEVNVEFGLENLGTQTETDINVRYYISTNSYISTGDRKIKTASIPVLFNEGIVNVHKELVRIPSDLEAGKIYYLGIIIDYDNKIAELSESNNATYLPIKIL